MKQLDWAGAILWTMLVVAIEVVGRNKREAWWGWFLYLGTAISLFLWILGRHARGGGKLS